MPPRPTSASVLCSSVLSGWKFQCFGGSSSHTFGMSLANASIAAITNSEIATPLAPRCARDGATVEEHRPARRRCWCPRAGPRHAPHRGRGMSRLPQPPNITSAANPAAARRALKSMIRRRESRGGIAAAARPRRTGSNHSHRHAPSRGWPHASEVVAEACRSAKPRPRERDWPLAVRVFRVPLRARGRGRRDRSRSAVTGAARNGAARADGPSSSPRTAPSVSPDRGSFGAWSTVTSQPGAPGPGNRASGRRGHVSPRRRLRPPTTCVSWPTAPCSSPTRPYPTTPADDGRVFAFRDGTVRLVPYGFSISTRSPRTATAVVVEGRGLQRLLPDGTCEWVIQRLGRRWR